MTRKSMPLDNMFLVRIGFDILKTTKSIAEIQPYIYDEKTVGTKMPGSKRYVANIYLPMPDELIVDREITIRDAEEVNADEPKES